MTWADEKAREIRAAVFRAYAPPEGRSLGDTKPMEDVIAQALRDERERCAKVVEDMYRLIGGHTNENMFRMCPQIAAAIRKQDDG